jgi:ubiquitin C-terminal hydrolase
MHTAASSESSVSPFAFLQALGVLVKDGDGRPLDGEMQTDADEFYNSLLHHLETEEMNSRDSYKDPTVVQNLLGCATAYIVSNSRG